MYARKSSLRNRSPLREEHKRLANKSPEREYHHDREHRPLHRERSASPSRNYSKESLRNRSPPRKPSRSPTRGGQKYGEKENDLHDRHHFSHHQGRQESALNHKEEKWKPLNRPAQTSRMSLFCRECGLPEDPLRRNQYYGQMSSYCREYAQQSSCGCVAQCKPACKPPHVHKHTLKKEVKDKVSAVDSCGKKVGFGTKVEDTLSWKTLEVHSRESEDDDYSGSDDGDMYTREHSVDVYNEWAAEQGIAPISEADLEATRSRYGL